MADPKPGAVPFREAIGFFRQKLDLPTETWTDLWQGMHARAFVVAGAQQAELVADFRAAVDNAIANGTTLADFRKDFDRIVEAHGWSYNGSRGWRSKVIFETNLRTSYAAGKWEQAQRLKERRPYLRYVSVQDERTRPEHRDWHGTILPADDPWWSSHFPPNGWNCRCTVQQLSDRDLKRLGYQVSDKAPPVEMERRTVNTPEGKVPVDVPRGIDTGFSYNVGESAWGRGQQQSALRRAENMEPLLPPGGRRPAAPDDLPVEETEIRIGDRVKEESAMREALRRSLGGDSRVLTDPAGGRVAITQGLVDHYLERPARLDDRTAYFPFMRDLVEDPREIWVEFSRDKQSGRVSVVRRYVKLLRLEGDTVVGMVASSDAGFWSAFTFFRGSARGINGLRRGVRIYRKK